MATWTIAMTSRPSAPTVDALERALAFARAGFVATADDVRELPVGLVLSTSSLRAVWSVNQLRVSEPLSFDALVALADEQLADFGYQHIVVEDQLAGPGLEDAFRAAGWRTDVELVMSLTGAPDRAPDADAVVEAGKEEVLEVMHRWHDDGWASGSDELDQLVAYGRREANTHADDLLGVRSSDGRLLAITKLRGDGRTAQVDAVYTVPEARGRGYARALVSRAAGLAREAGHDLIFIVADDRDWPKLLYERLGFTPLGRIWQFHRG
jgi:GNAT superfamily N-acetyltransferase